jgi:hypothetical protein
MKLNREIKILKSYNFPAFSFHTSILCSIMALGVKESQLNSMLIFLVDKLSKMIISCLRSLKCSEVGQPQNPSPENFWTELSQMSNM